MNLRRPLIAALLACAPVFAEDPPAAPPPAAPPAPDSPAALLLRACENVRAQKGYHVTFSSRLFKSDTPEVTELEGKAVFVAPDAAHLILRLDIAEGQKEYELYRKGPKARAKSPDGSWVPPEELGDFPGTKLAHPENSLGILRDNAEAAVEEAEESVNGRACRTLVLHLSPERFEKSLRDQGYDTKDFDLEQGVLTCRALIGREDALIYRLAIDCSFPLKPPGLAPGAPAPRIPERDRTVFTFKVRLDVGEYNRNLELNPPKQVRDVLGL